MALQTVNTSTDNVSDLCSVVNNNAGEAITSASSNGSTLTLTKSNAGTITANLGVVVASGTVSIAGTQADILTALAQTNAKLFFNYGLVTSGTPSVLYVSNIDPGVSITLESATSVTATIRWMIIA